MKHAFLIIAHKEYRDVFEDSHCRKTIHDLIEDTIQYLLTVKEKTL